MFSLKRVLFTVIFFISLLFTGCSQITGAGPDNSIVPLKIGNSWTYRFTDYDTALISSKTEEETRVIVKDTAIGDMIWYGYNDLPAGIWFANKADGLWEYICRNGTSIPNDTSVIVYKYPVSAGEDYDDPRIPKHIIATDEVITVPAGTFKTIHLLQSFSPLNNNLLNSVEIYIAPQLGEVKFVQYGKRADGSKYIVYKKELESYILK